jgi:hypothetical protein
LNDDDDAWFFGDLILTILCVLESKQFEEDDYDGGEDGPANQKSPGQWLSGGSFW